MNVTAFNQWAWDKQVDRGNPWTRPVSSAEVANAKQGEWSILLTPVKQVPKDWFPSLNGCDVLCLASGGGQQGPILAAAGAAVTVFDNSPKQLGQDRIVAERENLSIKIVQGDMADLSVFAGESFDLIVHPVSNVFVPDVIPVWRESFRVLRRGGLLLAGFTNPILYLIDHEEFSNTGRLEVRNRLPYSDVESLSPMQRSRCETEGIPLEFGHSLADQIGGQIAAGFVITGLYEDVDREENESPMRRFTPLYLATRAAKPNQ